MGASDSELKSLRLKLRELDRIISSLIEGDDRPASSMAPEQFPEARPLTRIPS